MNYYSVFQFVVFVKNEFRHHIFDEFGFAEVKYEVFRLNAIKILLIFSEKIYFSIRL